ncbi:CYTH domain-containing protein [Ilumatobacter fluminis]|uniref:CYTH domain-containing protein n=1 Tax=Ilumatobacter fluminis TaxID=467091 RepID=A0A4R7HVF2_9ACTN|nr:CYTH domain-containing protein [Ilumatobacter fluminis]TDT14454.1 CYTH domain-containing protein [Ilumatobacter fluminis]
MIEIERRFLVERVPDDLPTPVRIEQAYLVTEPVSVRVRRKNSARILTIKAGSGLARTEIERELTDEEFDALWQQPTELRIEKRRHELDLGNGHTAELDLFDGDLAGRVIVEVEFPDTDAAARFDPPDWFGTEVTDDSRYTNAALARHGWPE